VRACVVGDPFSFLGEGLESAAISPKKKSAAHHFKPLRHLAQTVFAAELHTVVFVSLKLLRARPAPQRAPNLKPPH